MPGGYQISPLNRQTINNLSSPGVQRGGTSAPGIGSTGITSQGGIPSPLNGQGVGTAAPQPGSSSYSPPSSSIMGQQGQMGQQPWTTTGMGQPPPLHQAPFMGGFTESPNRSTLIRSLVGNPKAGMT